MVTTQTKQTPLDMLVISQLAAIRRSEALLQERLLSHSSLEASHIAAEVWKLQTSADRLSRMIDAMNPGGSFTSRFIDTPAAA